jgi:NAD(P)H-flavin reductase
VSTEIVARGAKGFGSWVWLAVAGVKADKLNPHPFSVASIDPSKHEVKLLIKVGGAGSWTAALAASVEKQEAANGNGNNAGTGSTLDGLEGALLAPAAAAATQKLQGLEFNLDGPYGRPTLPLEACSSLVLFGGGIGVTPLLPILAAVTADPEPALMLPKLRHLVFVWSVRSQESFEYAATELRCAAASMKAAAADEAAAGGGRAVGDRPTVEVRLHLTAGNGGAPPPAPPVLSPLQAFEHTVECSRPDVSAILTRVKAADDAEGGVGTMGFVCGPAAMARSVRDAGWSCGVPVHAESFEM